MHTFMGGNQVGDDEEGEKRLFVCCLATPWIETNEHLMRLYECIELITKQITANKE